MPTHIYNPANITYVFKCLWQYSSYCWWKGEIGQAHHRYTTLINFNNWKLLNLLQNYHPENRIMVTVGNYTVGKGRVGTHTQIPPRRCVFFDFYKKFRRFDSFIEKFVCHFLMTIFNTKIYGIWIGPIWPFIWCYPLYSFLAINQEELIGKYLILLDRKFFAENGRKCGYFAGILAKIQTCLSLSILVIFL